MKQKVWLPDAEAPLGGGEDDEDDEESPNLETLHSE